MCFGRRQKKEDLSSEPTLFEALADPVVQAMMARDRLTPGDMLAVAFAARAKLLDSGGEGCTREYLAAGE